MIRVAPVAAYMIWHSTVGSVQAKTGSMLVMVRVVEGGDTVVHHR